MLCAYYDKSCDSETLFDSYAIADDPTYKIHLNQYHVVNLDISGFVSEAKARGVSLKDVPIMINDALLADVVSLYPELDRYSSLNECLLALVLQTGTKIIFIIDEWDAMIRETQQDPEAQDRYFNLLRGWFKNNNFTPAAIASAYMTGILPIKKDGSQSAISDFQEYTMIKPRKFCEYVGFTEMEVRKLCEMYNVSFETMKQWYDGYSFKDVGSVYNPMFLDTIHKNEEAVAAHIEKIHEEVTSPLHYNKEDSLRSVIKLAYYTYRDHYLQWEELPAGSGYADVVYLPKRDSDWPILVIELKWNLSADGAIDQILRQNYPDAFRYYGCEILLVGINYDKDAPAGKRKHTCKIIRVDKQNAEI